MGPRSLVLPAGLAPAHSSQQPLRAADLHRSPALRRLAPQGDRHVQGQSAAKARAFARGALNAAGHRAASEPPVAPAPTPASAGATLAISAPNRPPKTPLANRVDNQAKVAVPMVEPLPAGFAERIAKMRQPNSYGEEFECAALAHCVERIIVVHSINKADPAEPPQSTRHGVATNDRAALHLLLIKDGSGSGNGNHFEPLVDYNPGHYGGRSPTFEELRAHPKVKIRGDGNCLFNSVSEAMNRELRGGLGPIRPSEARHEALRRAAADWAEQHPYAVVQEGSPLTLAILASLT